MRFPLKVFSEAKSLAGLTHSSLALCLAFSSCGASRSPTPQQTNPETQTKPAVEKKQRAAIDPNKFALVITSVGGEEAYTKTFSSQAARLYDALINQLGFEEKNVFLLTETAGGGGEDGAPVDDPAHSRRATAVEVRKS